MSEGMELNPDQINLLEQIADSDVEFVIFRDYTLTGGFIELSVKKLCEYLRNPTKFLLQMGATEAGVSLDKYKQWREVERKDDGRARCKGIRTNGKRCNMGVELPLPRDFNADIDLYCRHHSRLGGNSSFKASQESEGNRLGKASQERKGNSLPEASQAMGGNRNIKASQKT